MMTTGHNSLTLKVVVNRCYGGFSLSRTAYRELGLEWDGYGFAYSDDRANPKLVATVEKLGNRASGDCAKLKVVTISYGYEINDHDGMETASGYAYAND